MVAKVRDYYATETQHLRGLGVPAAGICSQLDLTPDALARALQREGRHDLANEFERMRPNRRKPGKCATCGAPTSEPRRDRCYPCGIAARDNRPRTTLTLWKGTTSS